MHRNTHPQKARPGSPTAVLGCFQAAAAELSAGGPPALLLLPSGGHTGGKKTMRSQAFSDLRELVLLLVPFLQIN